MQLADRVAVVSGAAQGIGRAIAVALAEWGAKVALVDIDQQNLDDMVADFKARGWQALGYATNVSDSAAVDKLFSTVEEQLGPVDILVNNAGISRPAWIHKMSDEDWDAVLKVNLTGYFYTTRAAARSMRARRSGVMVNISSIAAVRGTISQINYGAAKAGVIGLTKAAATELASFNIRLNAFAPGATETRMTETVRNNEKMHDHYLKEIPLGKWGQPEDIARAVRFLASDESAFITGQVINANGGAYMQ